MCPVKCSLLARATIVFYTISKKDIRLPLSDTPHGLAAQRLLVSTGAVTHLVAQAPLALSTKAPSGPARAILLVDVHVFTCLFVMSYQFFETGIVHRA
jgi:hypothetical protein